MNINYPIINYPTINKKLVSYHVLSHYICGDIIEKVGSYIIDPSFEKKHNNLLNEIKDSEKRKNIMMHRFMWYHRARGIELIKTPTCFLSDTHGKDCCCDICIHRVDFPRYVYLTEIDNDKQSKQTQRWIFFLKGLHGVLGFSQDEIKHYGFCSIYDRHNHMKVISPLPVIKSNLFLITRNQWLRVHQYWEQSLNHK